MLTRHDRLARYLCSSTSLVYGFHVFPINVHVIPQGNFGLPPVSCDTTAISNFVVVISSEPCDNAYILIITFFQVTITVANGYYSIVDLQD